MSATGRAETSGGENEWFPTPNWLTEAIIPALGNPKTIWEPACHGHAMVDVLKRSFPHSEVFCSDIMGCGIGDARVDVRCDFLETKKEDLVKAGFKIDCIITNPPFSLAEAFVRHGLNLIEPDGAVFILQRLNFLGSAKRAPWFRSRMPDVHVTPRRPPFARSKTTGKFGTDSCEYSWFEWSIKSTGRIFILPTEGE